MTGTRLRLLLAGFTIVATGSLGATERLTLKVSPAVSFAPANLIVRTMVAADKANRAIEIVADSGSFLRSSEIQLDGEHAPRASVFEFRSMPGGVYEVRATLKDGGGKALASSETHVHVVEGVVR